MVLACVVVMADIEIDGSEFKAEQRNEKKVKSKFWPTFRRAVSVIPFAEDVVAAYYCALDQQTPHRVRVILLAALGYFIMPFDAIPDILLGVGFTDDATLLLSAIAMVRAHINDDHREAASQALADQDLDT